MKTEFFCYGCRKYEPIENLQPGRKDKKPLCKMRAEIAASRAVSGEAERRKEYDRRKAVYLSGKGF